MTVAVIVVSETVFTTAVIDSTEKSTCAPARKFVPVIVTGNAAPPSACELGATFVTVGTGCARRKMSRWTFVSPSTRFAATDWNAT